MRKLMRLEIGTAFLFTVLSGGGFLPTVPPPAVLASDGNEAGTETVGVDSGDAEPEIPWGGTRGATVPNLRKRSFGDYPVRARKAKIGGQLIIQVLVRRDGSTQVEKLLGCRVWKLGKRPDDKYSEYCPDFFETSEKVVESWKYAPALFEGRPIDSYIAVSFAYQKSVAKARSVVWTEEEIEAMLPPGATLDDGELDRSAPLERRAAALPPEEPWLEVRTKNFTVLSNAGESQALVAGRRLETLREVLSRLHGGTAVQSPRPTTTYLFRDELSFAPYTIRAGLQGYFFESYDGNVIAIHSHPGFPDVIYHEYIHYFLANNLPHVPRWLNEGMAELYSTLSVVEHEVKIGEVVGPHIAELRSKDWIPADELFGIGPDAEIYDESARRGLFYAQSWAFVHYLLLGNPDLTPRLTDLLERSGRGEQSDVAFQAAFGVSPGTLSEEVAAYLAAGRFPSTRVRFDELNVPVEAESRELSRAETLVHLGNLLVHVDPEKPEGPAEHFRAALELEPELAIAHRGLGLLGDSRGDRDAALASLAMAARLDPDDDLTLLIQAKVLLDEEIGRIGESGEPEIERLDEIERLLERSAALNPERADTVRMLGTVLMFRRSCEAGPRLLKQAWQMMPSEITIARDLATVLAHCGETESAKHILETYLLPFARPEDVEQVKQSLFFGELNATVELAAQGRTAEAVTRLEALLEPVEDPGIRSEIEGRLASLRRVDQVRDFAARYDRATEALEGGSPKTALELARALSADLDAAELNETEAVIGLRSAVSEFVGCGELLVRLDRADELLRTGDFLPAIKWLEETGREIQRTLDQEKTPCSRDLLQWSAERVEQELQYGWSSIYQQAVKLAVEGDRDSAKTQIEEFIERCPYPDLVASARKSLEQLGPR